MTDQQFMIDLGEDQRAIVEPDDSGWLRDKLRQEPGSTRLRVRFDEDDTEGHRARVSTAVRVIAEEDDDTEGHAISIHFPSREEADTFRKRLLITGVLAGTIALGAAGGVGLANLTSDDAGAGAAQTTVTGSDWSQAERQPAIAPAVGGSDWSQAERPAAASVDGSGSAWTQDERPGTATTGTASSDDDSAAEAPFRGGPTPE
ncbi:MAG: hypothetical protein ABIP01_01815 [Candidatus Limnocylindria bacterium]